MPEKFAGGTVPACTACLAVRTSLHRQHGQIGKALKPIPGRSSRAVPGAGRFPLLPVLPVPSDFLIAVRITLPQFLYI